MYVHWREHLRQQEQNAPFFLGPEETDRACLLTIAATPKFLHWLGESDHVITMGPERKEVYKLILEFIDTTVQDVAKLARPDAALRDEGAETPPGR